MPPNSTFFGHADGQAGDVLHREEDDRGDSEGVSGDRDDVCWLVGDLYSVAINRSEGVGCAVEHVDWNHC